jgi:hypothetical protein
MGGGAVSTHTSDEKVTPEQQTMQAAGFEWEPTDAGYPRWTYRSKDIWCVRPPHVTDEEWEQRKKEHIAQSKLNMPPSFFAGLGSPCCSRWMKSEIEWIALAYVQALANDGDTWKHLSREQTYALLTDEQKRHVHGRERTDTSTARRTTVIGLAKGLAWRAYRETRPGECDWIEWYKDSPTFGLVPRREAAFRYAGAEEFVYPTSARYYELIDRVPHTSCEEPK